MMPSGRPAPQKHGIEDADSMASHKAQPTQLESIAATFRGWTYEHGIQDRQEHQRVVAQGPSSKTLKSYIQELQGQKLVRPSLVKSDKEDGPPLAKHPQYLVVGLAILGSDDLSLKNFAQAPPEAKKGEAVGHSTNSGTLPTQHEPLTPLRVVVQISSVLQSKAMFYALVNTGANYCVPFVIPQPEVFFFKEFRGDETDANKRSPGWSATIRKAAFDGPEPLDRDDLTISAGRPLTTSQHRVPLLRSLRTELTTTAALLRRDGNYHFDAARMLRTLDEFLPEIQKFPPPSQIGLRAFLNVEGYSTFTMHDSENLVEDLREQWPDIRELIKVEDIYMIARGLRLTMTKIHLYSVRVFILTASKKLSKRRSKDAEALGTNTMAIDGDNAIEQDAAYNVWLGKMVQQAVMRAQEFTGYQKPFNVSIEHDPTHAALIHCAASLESIADSMDKQSRLALEQIGDRIAESTDIPDLVEEFKHCADQGTLKLFAGQAARILAVNSSNVISACAAKIREVAEQLRQISRRPSTETSQD